MKDSLSSVLAKSNYTESETLLGHAEAVIIEAIISKPTLIEEHGLTPQHFDNDIFEILFKTVSTIESRKLVVSTDLVVACLKENDCYSSVILESFETMKGWGSISPNLSYYVGLLKDRRFAKETDETLLRSQLTDGAPAERAIKLIESISDLVTKYAPPRVNNFDADWAAVERVSTNAAKGVFPFKLNTYFPKLDRLLGEGVLDDYLFVLGADPGAGKTTFALNFAKNIAMYDKHSTAYFSFEMGRIRLMRWYMSACSSIPFSQFTDNTLTDYDWDSINGIKQSSLPPNALDIIECEANLDTILKEIRAHVKKRPDCKLIIIDHLHRITWGKSANAVEVQSAVTGALKDIILEIKVPILLLAHLVKAGKDDKAGAPRPELIKGSGTVIADADLAIIARMAPQPQQRPNSRVVNMYVVKNRGGAADSGAFSQICNIPGTGVMKDYENVIHVMN